MANDDVKNKIYQCLATYLINKGRGVMKFDDKTHLVYGLNLESEDGVYFVLDLCDILEYEFPKSFNPFVNAAGTHMNTVGEMVARVQHVLEHQELERERV